MKTAISAVSALLLTLALVGCSQDNSKTTNVPAGTTEQSTSTTEQSLNQGQEPAAATPADATKSSEAVKKDGIEQASAEDTTKAQQPAQEPAAPAAATPAAPAAEPQAATPPAQEPADSNDGE